jgi:D-arginine dehydrogenase
MSNESDIIVIGAGVAGASVAAHLARDCKVIVLEAEERPGYHSTGRSAATFEPNYGPPAIRALTRAAREFFESPPEGFVQAPLLEPRSTMFLVPAGQEDAGRRVMAEGNGLEEISVREAKEQVNALRNDYARTILLDRSTGSLDVDLLHQGFLKMIKGRGGELVCNAAAEKVARRNGAWHVTTRAGNFSAPILVNAAGAWGDVLADMAGVARSGLVPKRRSIAVIPGPPDIAAWPLVGDAGETWYAKPAGGKLLVSPADATPVEPHDAYADDTILAEGIDRFQQAIDLPVERVEHSWGGLRSFVPDGNPVCGYEPGVEGFFWLIGQGGYGIQTSPALSRLAAALIRHEPAPRDITDAGLDVQALSPDRLRGAK